MNTLAFPRPVRRPIEPLARLPNLLGATAADKARCPKAPRAVKSAARATPKTPTARAEAAAGHRGTPTGVARPGLPVALEGNAVTTDEVLDLVALETTARPALLGARPTTVFPRNTEQATAAEAPTTSRPSLPIAKRRLNTQAASAERSVPAPARPLLPDATELTTPGPTAAALAGEGITR